LVPLWVRLYLLLLLKSFYRTWKYRLLECFLCNHCSIIVTLMILFCGSLWYINDIKNIFSSYYVAVHHQNCTHGTSNFLDTIIIVEENRIVFNRFQKSTCSGRFLNFYSHYPLCHKRGVIICRSVIIIDRILLMSHPKFHECNLILFTRFRRMVILFISYSPRLITNSFFYIRKYKNSHIFYFPKKEVSTDKFFTIPYVKAVSKSFRLIVLKINSKLAYSEHVK